MANVVQGGSWVTLSYPVLSSQLLSLWHKKQLEYRTKQQHSIKLLQLVKMLWSTFLGWDISGFWLGYGIQNSQQLGYIALPAHLPEQR